MKPLYSEKEYKETKSTDKLPCECYQCGNTFHKVKKEITYELKHNRGLIKFCSRNCYNLNQNTQKKVNCTNCGVDFNKSLKEIKKNKSGNHYCSNSCNATYCNKNKKYGTRRSKLEQWLEEQLILNYPKLEIHFNRKDAIGSELDIYFPSLNVAFELNGIFHYEPIFGVDKLHKIQENDISKSKACFDAKIDLCIIDTSAQKYVKPKTSQKYLDIIINILDERMVSV